MIRSAKRHEADFGRGRCTHPPLTYNGHLSRTLLTKRSALVVMATWHCAGGPLMGSGIYWRSGGIPAALGFEGCSGPSSLFDRVDAIGIKGEMVFDRHDRRIRILIGPHSVD